METPTGTKCCVACGVTDMDAPLIPLDYRNARYWICSQHLPVLIHNPSQLMGKLPDADKLKSAKGHD